MLKVAPASGGSAVSIAVGAWQVLPTFKSKIFFSVADGTNVSSTLLAFDTASSAPPTTLVSYAQDYVLTPARTKLVYLWSYAPGASAGIWSLPLP